MVQSWWFNLLIYLMLAFGLAFATNDTKSRWLCIAAIPLLYGALSLHIVRRFLKLNKPWSLLELIHNKTNSEIFDYIRKVLESGLTSNHTTKKDEPIDPQKHLYKNVKDMWGFFRVIWKASQITTASHLIVGYFLLLVSWTFFFCIVTFGGLYQALFVLDPHSLAGFQGKTIWSHLYLSFITMVMVEDPNYYPLNQFGRLIYATEIIFSLIIGMILFFVFTQLILTRYEDSFNKVKDILQEQAFRIGRFLEIRSGVSLNDAYKIVSAGKSDDYPVGLRWFENLLYPCESEWTRINQQYSEWKEQPKQKDLLDEIDKVSQESDGENEEEGDR